MTHGYLIAFVLGALAVECKTIPRDDITLMRRPTNGTSLLMLGASNFKQSGRFLEEHTTKQAPDLDALLVMLSDALKKYQFQYFSEIAEKDGLNIHSLLDTTQRANFNAVKVWHTFKETMDRALSNSSLHLDTDFGPPRSDDSIFISVASYRDPDCRATVRKAFETADNPEKVSVGVVQQNCVSRHDCMTGTGWADTRRWVPQPDPDPDCIKDFCASDLGKPHCEAGRVRILRLNEAEAYGPFFARYLNAKLWRGENYFMQIDSHSSWRHGWDSLMVQMIKRTPSYPDSVISNYPHNHDESRAELRESGVASGLCGASFESAGGDRKTVRMQEGPVHFKNGVPPYSSYVAAGFFFSHGSIVSRVPPDPFLPYIFMGEEVALSARLWTAGYDIYAPTVEVLGHEYVRAEHPKFWESVGMVFSNGGAHNDLSNLIIERVQHLIGFPEAQRPDQVDPSVLIRMDEFGIGKVRSLNDFLRTMQLDVTNKVGSSASWCRAGGTPPVVRVL